MSEHHLQKEIEQLQAELKCLRDATVEIEDYLAIKRRARADAASQNASSNTLVILDETLEAAEQTLEQHIQSIVQVEQFISDLKNQHEYENRTPKLQHLAEINDHLDELYEKANEYANALIEISKLVEVDYKDWIHLQSQTVRVSTFKDPTFNGDGIIHAANKLSQISYKLVGEKETEQKIYRQVSEEAILTNNPRAKDREVILYALRTGPKSERELSKLIVTRNVAQRINELRKQGHMVQTRMSFVESPSGPEYELID